MVAQARPDYAIEAQWLKKRNAKAWCEHVGRVRLLHSHQLSAKALKFTFADQSYALAQWFSEIVRKNACNILLENLYISAFYSIIQVNIAKPCVNAWRFLNRGQTKSFSFSCSIKWPKVCCCSWNGCDFTVNQAEYTFFATSSTDAFRWITGPSACCCSRCWSDDHHSNTRTRLLLCRRSPTVDSWWVLAVYITVETKTPFFNTLFWISLKFFA